MTTLLAFLPDEAYVLVPVALGLLVILRVLRLGRAMGILGALMIFAFLGPFISAIMGALPLWLLMILGAFFLYGLIHAISGAALGGGVRDQLLGSLLRDLLFLPFRLTGGILRAIFGAFFRRARQ